MKITTQQSSIQKALSIVSSCVKGNVSNLQFSSVRMGWKGGVISAEASDIVSGILVTFSGSVAGSGEGEAYFNPVPVSEYLSTLGAGEVVLDVDEDKMTVSMGSSKATFPLVILNDYPRVALGDAPAAGILELDLDRLDQAITWASVSVAADESRPVLTGVLFRSVDENTLQVVGSDGYRLSLSMLPAAGQLPKDMLVPQRPLVSFLRDWAFDGRVRVWVDEKASRICFEGGDRSFYIRLIAGDFPNFAKILPKSTSLTCAFDRTEMMTAVRQVSLFARQAANTLMCDVAQNQVRLYTKEGQGGQAEAVVEAKVTGDNHILGFNYRYLQEYLKAATEKEIVMSCNGPLAPVQFVGDGKEGALHIIMPVNVKS